MSDQETTGFKVVDKRRFNEDGKEGAPAEESVALKSDETAKANSKEPTMPQEELNFSSFLFGMYTQTLIFLGDIPHPETNQISTHIEAAKQNIDIMGILEEKTKGNLTHDESKLFEEILNTLRLQYVKKISK